MQIHSQIKQKQKKRLGRISHIKESVKTDSLNAPQTAIPDKHHHKNHCTHTVPQSPHVAVVTLIVVVSTAFSCSLPCAAHTHFTQIPLRARKTTFPKHLVVNYEDKKVPQLHVSC